MERERIPCADCGATGRPGESQPAQIGTKRGYVCGPCYRANGNGGLLRVGDLVAWRGAWGADMERSARVEQINRTSEDDPKGERAESLDSIPWAEVTGRAVVVSLDNGSWAYGSQLRRLVGGGVGA